MCSFRARLRWLNALKGTSTVLLVLVAVVYVVSLWSSFGFNLKIGEQLICATCDSGQLRFAYYGQDRDPAQPRFRAYYQHTYLFLDRAGPQGTIERNPLVIWFYLPLWIPTGFLLASTGVLWWLGRRRRNGDRCDGCGYNLCGNVSGTCPECGLALSASGPVGTRPLQRRWLRRM